MYGIWKQKKSSRIGSMMMTGLLLIVTFLTMRDSGAAWQQAAAGLFLCVVLGVFSLLRSPAKLFGRILGILLIFAIPALMILCLQNFTLNPLQILPMMFLVNYILVLPVYLAASFASGSFSTGYTVVSALFALIGIVNAVVVQFRGSPLVPWDLYSIRTAASVAGNYTFVFTWRFLFSLLGFAALIVAGRKNRLKIRNGFLRGILTVLMAAAVLVLGYGLQQDQLKEAIGMDTILFTPNVRYRNNGFTAAFVGDLHLIRVNKPAGYSTAEAEEIADTVSAQYTQTHSTVSDLAEEAPSFVVIMDEAFSDLSVLGDFQVSEDYMPNTRKLMQEYCGGYLMVSAKGGDTANTEYEFLTGDTMAFLPEGSVPYQQFVTDNVPALPSYLANLGYTTTAIHPYYADGWNRNSVYEKLGFGSYLSSEDFAEPEYLRGYISDKSAFEKIEEQIENSQKDEKLFIFEVTIQNHGGYTQETEDLTEEILLTSEEEQTSQVRAVERYLTLIRKTDEALGELVDYLENCGKPVVLVLFGDHQPSDSITDVIASLTGYETDSSLSEEQKSYQVPYLVWNNFGMEMESTQLTSANYLAADVLEAAGLPLTAYQQFLLQLQSSVPAISAGAYTDTEGNYYSIEDDNSLYSSQINQYNILDYNHLIDKSGRVTAVFADPAS